MISYSKETGVDIQLTESDSFEREINCYKLIIESTILAVMILFGTLNLVFMIAAFLIGIIAILRNPLKYTGCLIVFLLPMAGIFKLSPDSMSLFTFWEFFLILYWMYLKRFLVNKLEMRALVFFAYLFIVEAANGALAINANIKLVAGCLILLIFMQLEYEKMYKLLFLSYILGYIVSSFFRLLDGNPFAISAFVMTKETRVGVDYFNRFSGLYGDPNYYCINIIIALILVVILLRAKRIKLLSAVALAVPLLWFAALTNSKSAFLMLVVPAALFIQVFWERKNYVLFVLSIITVISFMFWVFSGKIALFNVVLERLKTGSDLGLNSLTTDRSAIWKDYFNFFNSHLLSDIFGRGLGYITLNSAAAHNTYIDLLYQLGAVGTAWLMSVIAGGFKQYRSNYNRSIVNYGVLICIMAMYLFLSELQFWDPPFHFIICFVALNIDLKNIG